MNFKDFFVKQSGRSDGEPLVFIHGLLGSHHNWGRIIPHFEDRYNVIVFDQRGHGKSAKPNTGYTPDEMAHDLLVILDGLNIKNANLVGHSMGAGVAFTFASTYPQRVSRLVIEDIGPEGNPANRGGLLKKIKSVPVPFENKLKAKEYLMNAFGDSKLGAFLYTSIQETQNGEGVWNFDVNMVEEILVSSRRTPRWDVFQKIQCPILVMRGENSDDLLRDEFEKMKSMNSNVRGVEITGSGHWIHFDQKDEFIKVLKIFLLSESSLTKCFRR